jgi:hypothetical protein
MTSKDDHMPDITQETFLILLNQTGDVCLSWGQDSEAQMKTYIEEKLAEGYIFFTIDKAFFGLVNRKRRVRSTDDIRGDRVFLDDAKAEELFRSGAVSLVEGRDFKFDVIKKAKNASEVLSGGAALAMRPLRGG